MDVTSFFMFATTGVLASGDGKKSNEGDSGRFDGICDVLNALFQRLDAAYARCFEGFRGFAWALHISIPIHRHRGQMNAISSLSKYFFICV